MQEKIGVVSPDVFKASTALAGGVARQGETCGALTGAILAIGCITGRETLQKTEQLHGAMEPAMKAFNLFKEKVGHSLCGEIHKIRYGKAYRLYIPEERQAFYDAGGHSRKGCPEVCGIGASVAADIILDIMGES